MSEEITVCCRTLDGSEFTLPIPSSSTVRSLQITTRHLDALPVLVKPDAPVSLDPQRSLVSQGVTSGDVILFVRQPVTYAADEIESETVSQADIDKLTASIKHTGQTSSHTGILTAPAEVNLMSLLAVIHEISCILISGSAAQQEAKADTDEENFDEHALAHLQGMGFSLNAAKRALRFSRMNVDSAINWLLDNSERDIDRPLTPPTVLRSLNNGSKFRPDPLLVQQLCAMGFQEDLCLAALELTDNNLYATMELFETGVDILAKLEEHRAKTLNIDSPHVQFFLGDARACECLRDERFRDALRTMIRDPDTIQTFLRDPRMGPLFGRLSETLTRGNG